MLDVFDVFCSYLMEKVVSHIIVNTPCSTNKCTGKGGETQRTKDEKKQEGGEGQTKSKEEGGGGGGGRKERMEGEEREGRQIEYGALNILEKTSDNTLLYLQIRPGDYV